MEGFSKLEQLIPDLQAIKKDYVALKKQSDDIKKLTISDSTDAITLNSKFLELENRAELAFRQYLTKIEENSELIKSITQEGGEILELELFGFSSNLRKDVKNKITELGIYFSRQAGGILIEKKPTKQDRGLEEDDNGLDFLEEEKLEAEKKEANKFKDYKGVPESVKEIFLKEYKPKLNSLEFFVTQPYCFGSEITHYKVSLDVLDDDWQVIRSKQFPNLVQKYDQDKTPLAFIIQFYLGESRHLRLYITAFNAIGASETSSFKIMTPKIYSQNYILGNNTCNQITGGKIPTDEILESKE